MGLAPGIAMAGPPASDVAILNFALTLEYLEAAFYAGAHSNASAFTGDTRAAGLFDDPAASIGLTRGVVMSSGDVHDVIGPNGASNTTTNLGQPGDSVLDGVLPSGQFLFKIEPIRFRKFINLLENLFDGCCAHGKLSRRKSLSVTIAIDLGIVGMGSVTVAEIISHAGLHFSFFERSRMV